MNYFKLVKDNNIIGVINSNNFMRYSPAVDCYLRTTEEFGEYVSYRGKFYRDYWMQPMQQSSTYEAVQILNITEEEYNILFEAFKVDETIIIDVPPTPDPQENEEYIDPVITSTIEYVRAMKIKEMNYICRQSIYDGFDVEQEDETTSHFAMTEQDQLNLMELNNMINSGLPQLPYHADGEEAKFYTPEEAQMIIAAATKHKLYHTSYFNCLKSYIQSLETIEEISAIEYGVEIPEEFQTEVYKMVI